MKRSRCQVVVRSTAPYEVGITLAGTRDEADKMRLRVAGRHPELSVHIVVC